MKQSPLAPTTQLDEVAQQTIFEQTSLLMSIRRTAWWLYGHEKDRGFSPHQALENVLKWMAEQAELLERVKREPTQLQRRMLQMLADGYSQKQIALELGRDGRTLRAHFYNIRRRVGVDSLYQVMAIATRKGWIRAKETDDLSLKLKKK